MKHAVSRRRFSKRSNRLERAIRLDEKRHGAGSAKTARALALYAEVADHSVRGRDRRHGAAP